MNPADEEEQAIKTLRMKKTIEKLENARGNGTSMISLIIRPGEQISKCVGMLQDEYGTASNIKSRVNRLSVLGAIVSAQQRLKLYNQVPPNGLVVFVGTVLTDEGKERKVAMSFEPFKPINTSLYLCDSRFHVEALRELLNDDDKFGFVVMDGNGTLFGTIAGNHREVLQKFSVELPKKHGRGGQSAVRFARLRMEKRHNYIRKVAELAVQHFITNDMPNVAGLVLAGSADFKSKLADSDLFDKRLANIIIKIVDISTGGESGFNQAIELSADSLANVRFVREKRLIEGYFDHIAQETGKFCYGVQDTMQALEMGAIETLIVWEDLDIDRIVFVNHQTEEQTTSFLNPTQQQDQAFFHDSETGTELDIVEREPLIDWLVENYKNFGAKIEFVSDRSQEGTQFCKGFGGIGGILRYRVDFAAMQYDSDDWSDYSTSDEGAI